MLVADSNLTWDNGRVVEIGIGEANLQLACNGIPGFGGLNRMFLNEEGWHTRDNTVEVIEPVTQHSGKIKLPSGYEVAVTLKDIRFDYP